MRLQSTCFFRSLSRSNGGFSGLNVSCMCALLLRRPDHALTAHRCAIDVHEAPADVRRPEFYCVFEGDGDFWYCVAPFS